MSRSFKKPWVKDSQPELKRIHSRRYRRYIRQDLKQWRNRYSDSAIRDCVYCECLEYWDTEYYEWCAGMAYELEPEYAPRDKWIPLYDICDWRIYYPDICSEIKYLRK